MPFFQHTLAAAGAGPRGAGPQLATERTSAACILRASLKATVTDHASSPRWRGGSFVAAATLLQLPALGPGYAASKPATPGGTPRSSSVTVLVDASATG